DAADGRQSDAHHPDAPAAERRRQGEAGGRQTGNDDDVKASAERAKSAENHGPRPLRSPRLNVRDEMPKKLKIKTHRGAAKRFKRTKNGKFLRGSAFKQHILSSKTRKRKRRLRGTTTVAEVDTAKLARMLPYK